MKPKGLELLVVEDVAPAHLIKKLTPDRTRAGIVGVKHSGSSPGLKAIGACWAYVKDKLRQYAWEAYNQLRNQARRASVGVWWSYTSLK
jgi:hypothetical protein